MPGLLPNIDPEGLLEFSVVYTDRALNHMSHKFQGLMRDISAVLKEVYGARSAVVVPGSGSFGMEAVARQFAQDRRCLVIRNGWFSYRWTQIFELGRIPAESLVVKARRQGEGRQAPFAPAPIDEVVATIRGQRPDLVFAELAAPGLSFPSGHATMSATVFLTLGVLIASARTRQKERAYILIVAGLGTVFVGLSRVLLGVHWATDVIGGWAFGTAWALLWLLVARWLARRREASG